jgi:branched-chain amino acid transport system ATP-binding protein
VTTSRRWRRTEGRDGVWRGHGRPPSSSRTSASARICAWPGGSTSLWRAARDALTAREREVEGVERALALVGLDGLADRGADKLAQGQRKLVDVARALAAEPTVLFLDEPAAGLDSLESQALGRHLRDVVAAGTAVVLVDHDMGLVLSVCDHVVVLDFGKVISRGKPDEVRSDPKVVEAYLGRTAIPAETT